MARTVSGLLLWRESAKAGAENAFPGIAAPDTICISLAAATHITVEHADQ
jgi:hypothetical protein